MTGSSAEKPIGTSLKSMLERIDSDADYGGPPPLSSDVDPVELLRGLRERIGGTVGSQLIHDRVQQDQPPFEEPHTSEVVEEKEPPRTIRMSSGFNVSSLSQTTTSEQTSRADLTADEEGSGAPEESAHDLGLSGGRLGLVLPKRTSSRVWLGVLASGAVLAGSAYLALLPGAKIPGWLWDGAFIQGGSIFVRGPEVATRSVEAVNVRKDASTGAGALPVVVATGRESGVVGAEETTKADDTASTTDAAGKLEVGEKGSEQNADAGSRQVATVDKPGIDNGPQDASEKTNVAAAQQVNEPDVVLVQPGDQIAVPVKLDPVHAPPDVAALMLSGFAPGFDVKNATATGAGTFVMLPQSLSEARVVVPSGSVGDTLVRVDMFNSGGARVAQTQFRLRVEPVMAIRTEADGIVQGLMDRGMKLMQSGDIGAARLMFKRALESGHAPGALALGETYDPQRLALAGVIGMRGDRAQAVYWYSRASSEGETRAQYRLKTLQAMKP